MFEVSLPKGDCPTACSLRRLVLGRSQGGDGSCGFGLVSGGLWGARPTFSLSATDVCTEDELYGWGCCFGVAILVLVECSRARFDWDAEAVALRFRVITPAGDAGGIALLMEVLTSCTGVGWGQCPACEKRVRLVPAVEVLYFVVAPVPTACFTAAADGLGRLELALNSLAAGVPGVDGAFLGAETVTQTCVLDGLSALVVTLSCVTTGPCCKTGAELPGGPSLLSSSTSSTLPPGFFSMSAIRFL